MLSHINDQGMPAMVDVSAKDPTLRIARAQTTVYLPAGVMAQLRHGNELTSPKGPVFQTAIVAGVMAAKRTGDLIPLCHPLPLEHCDIGMTIISDTEVEIICTATTSSKTGVEMEALTGASLAALTLYDMCKALSHGIEIRNTVLLSKTGGKKDWVRP